MNADQKPPELAAPDFRALFESAPGLYLVLDPELCIVAVSDAYLRAAMLRREDILGRRIFEVVPDRPDDAGAMVVHDLYASLGRVLRGGRGDAMRVRKCGFPRHGEEGGGCEIRYWKPVNSPVFGADGALAYIIHHVEDVTGLAGFGQRGSELSRLTEALRERAVRMRCVDLARLTRLVASCGAETPGAPAAQADAEKYRRILLDLLPDAFLPGSETGGRMPEEPSAPGQPAHAAPADGGTPLILVVEDDPDMNALIAEALGRDYRVLTAFDGCEGLDKALEFRPDLILSDMRMPGMSGDALVRELRRREETRDIPVVVLTAEADEALRLALLREGVKACLYKPFCIDELLARVDKIVAERGSMAERPRRAGK